MIKNPIQFEAEKIHLSPEEKTAVRGALALFAAEHPLGTQKNQATKKIFTLSNIFFLKPAPISLLITLVLSVGTSFAAEGSLPGEALYPIKVGVNERVREWTALSADAQASWQARAAERRLEEAVTLAAENRITPDIRAQIEENFEKHAERVQDHITHLETRASETVIDISSQFETSLSAHAAMLEQLPAEQTNREEMVPLLDKVQAQARTASESRRHAENRIATSSNIRIKITAEERLKSARKKIAEVQKFIDQSSAHADLKTEAHAQLQAAEQVLAEGTARVETEFYNEAFFLFQDANRIAQEIKLLVKTQENLDDRIRLTIPSIRARTDSHRVQETATSTNKEIND